MKNFQKKFKIPSNVEIKKIGDVLLFFGPLGCSTINMKKLDPKGVGAIAYNKQAFIISSYSKSFLGSICSHVINQIHGVTRGFLVYLRIVGVGYRAQLENQYTSCICQSLHLKLGFSHDLQFTLPPSVRAFLLEPTLIGFYGIDKNQVTQTAAKIRQLRTPSVYKGKGIRFINEVVTLKLGKRK